MKRYITTSIELGIFAPSIHHLSFIIHHLSFPRCLLRCANSDWTRPWSSARFVPPAKRPAAPSSPARSSFAARSPKNPATRSSPRTISPSTVPERYVSRGGFKLEHGLRHFQLDARGLTAIDLGASTGGFTDCLLQNGAARVFAVDVGRGQLAWKLRQDPRVVVMERTNARHLTPQSFPPPFAGADLVVADCSFISLRKIFPAAVALLRGSGKILALVKPQFEAGKAEADRGAGVITDPAIHARVLRELREFPASEPRPALAGRDGIPAAWPGRQQRISGAA